MPTSLVYEIKGSQEETHKVGSWMLPNWSVEWLILHHLSPESNHPWVPWGEGTGRASAYESSLRRTLETQKTRNPGMASLPIRLYDPSTKKSFILNGSQPAPSYVVISYTWGRWMRSDTRDHDTIIVGANWRAPANELFSRDMLDHAVQKISGGSNAWVDVFCIPQDDKDPEKSIEIGKQSAIFRCADRAAVWLGTGGQESLVDVCSWVPEVVYMVSPLVFNFIGDPTEAARRLKVLADFTEHLPWASSLWTLQEAALRPDAAFFGKEGDVLLHRDSGDPITVKHLRNTMKAVWNELSDEIDRTRSPVGDRGMQKEDKNFIEEKARHQNVLCSAIQVVNDIALHRLGTMNAGELLFASKHRTASREHDRVFGIMGAIGINIAGSYDDNASEIMDRFLLKLHQERPVEMQAFFRDGLSLPDARHWLIDETAQLLTLLRQHEPPRPPAFMGITHDGKLLLDKVEYLKTHGLAELKGYILSSRALMASDRPIFHQFTDVNENGGEATNSIHLSHLCVMLDHLASLTEICVLHVGTVSGLQVRGMREAYLILTESSGKRHGSAYQQHTSPFFTRLGLVISAERFSFTQTVYGRFFLK